ncbi:MAG: resistance protein [Labilithrix sp.]|nr:resistance protein [Labilithrix sp.]
MQHVKYDLGQVKRGSTVVVTLDKQANVLLMDSSNYSNYASGRRHQYIGGLVKKSPVSMPVPRDGHWYVAVDLGGSAGSVRSGIRVQPPPRGNLPAYREPGSRPLRDVLDVRVPQRPADPEVLDGRTWDVFISHASEDKPAVAIPLAEALQARGVTAWLDKAELRIGESLRRRIDQGLAASRFAVVVLSPSYFAKGWPQYELDGIVTLSVAGRQNLLPIWHDLGHADVMAKSPSLADKIARSTANTDIDAIADEIAELVVASR